MRLFLFCLLLMSGFSLELLPLSAYAQDTISAGTSILYKYESRYDYYGDLHGGVTGKVIAVFANGKIQVKWDNKADPSVLPRSQVFVEITEGQTLKPKQQVLYPNAPAVGYVARQFEGGNIVVKWENKDAWPAVMQERELRGRIEATAPYNEGAKVLYFNGIDDVTGTIVRVFDGDIAEIKWDNKGATNAFLLTKTLTPMVDGSTSSNLGNLLSAKDNTAMASVFDKKTSKNDSVNAANDIDRSASLGFIAGTAQ